LITGKALLGLQTAMDESKPSQLTRGVAEDETTRRRDIAIGVPSIGHAFGFSFTESVKKFWKLKI
jgi:hypothetical protein